MNNEDLRLAMYRLQEAERGKNALVKPADPNADTQTHAARVRLIGDNALAIARRVDALLDSHEELFSTHEYTINSPRRMYPKRSTPTPDACMGQIEGVDDPKGRNFAFASLSVWYNLAPRSGNRLGVLYAPSTPAFIRSTIKAATEDGSNATIIKESELDLDGVRPNDWRNGSIYNMSDEEVEAVRLATFDITETTDFIAQNYPKRPFIKGVLIGVAGGLSRFQPRAR